MSTTISQPPGFPGKGSTSFDTLTPDQRVASPITPRTEGQEQARRPRFGFLDGMRGLAALTIVLHHLYQFAVLPYSPHIPTVLRLLLGWTWPWGRLAVDAFIVLSGYSLMLPVARSADGALTGGVKGFLYRRARRILPPYYAALALTLAFASLVPIMRTPLGDVWDDCLPMFTPGIVLSHLLMVHNLSRGWVMKIDGVMWTVATEWQIYFIFGLMLLPVWRRLGTAAAVSLGFFLGLSPMLVQHFHRGFPTFSQAAPWYIGEFALGMWGAVITSKPMLPGRAKQWLIGIVGLAAAMVVFRLPDPLFGRYETFFMKEIASGFVTLLVILHCHLRLTALNQAAVVSRGPVLGLLDAQPSRLLGRFSYSLYLVHAPILVAILRGFRILLPGWEGTEATLLLTLPVVLATAYCFYLVFERPFVSTRAARRSETAVILGRVVNLGVAQ